MRLRFINAGAATYFDLRIPGLQMTVVSVDGQHVQPVTVDEIRIAIAETYDVIVEPKEERAYTIFAEAMDRSGFARGTLATENGITAAIPPRRDRVFARPPGREIELHITGNMERYIWGFDGKKFSEADGPIKFYHGERLRLTLVNDTMMNHPIHLHGMFMELDNGAGANKPRKHTVNVKPAERLSLDTTADALGNWAFHCHVLYHMEMGMFRIVSVVENKEGSAV